MAKKKIKKLLKKVLPALAIAGMGRAFMNRNARGSSDANAVKLMTSDAAYSDDSMPSMLTKNMGKDRFSTRRRDSVLADPGINRMYDYYGESLKKGGRVGCGKAKRGFGRAMTKGKK